MENNIEKTQKMVVIEKLQNDVEMLQEDINRLKMQVAALSTTDLGKQARDMEACDSPHTATDKFQRCKKCKYMRMPHKSNAHYSCNVRHAIIEPTWTCGLYDNN